VIEYSWSEVVNSTVSPVRELTDLYFRELMTPAQICDFIASADCDMLVSSEVSTYCDARGAEGGSHGKA
jgi:hypothetical protein